MIEIEQALANAKAEREAGRIADAELAYAEAAELARAARDETALAHALRHISDLARERGASAEAWRHASEAAALYRKGADRLGLANALRLQALSTADGEQARQCWREARELYASLEVPTGVAECDRHLQSPN